MPKPRWGSRLIIIGGIALILMSAYTLYVQLETSWAWLQGIFNASRVQGTSALGQLGIMFQTTPALRLLISQILFLLAMVIIAVIAISVRRRVAACAILLPVLALAYWAGCSLNLYPERWGSWIFMLRAAPVALLAVGCLLQIIDVLRLRRQNGRPAYQPGVAPRTRRDKRCVYRDAPGAVRMVPPAEAPRIQPAGRRKPRQEKPVPKKPETHLGEPGVASAEPERYQWKTIKK